MKAQSKVSQKLQNILSLFVMYFRYFLKKIASMDKYEKIIIIGVLVVLVLVIFFPIMLISPNTTNISTSFWFLLSLSFVKSFVLIVGSLGIVLLRSFNKKVKIFVIEKLWFQGNKYLINVLLLWLSLGSFVSLGETIGLLSDYTTVVKLTSIYYIIQIFLIILVAFCLFMIFSSHHHKFKGHVVWYHWRKKMNEEDNNEWWLFDDVYHEDE